MADRPRVAFLGLGQMGAPMAANLARAGFPLTVWNRTPRSLPVDGVAVALTPAAAAAEADVVITMLADGAALIDVYTDPDGVLTTLRAGAVAVDMGTSGPDAVAPVAAAVAAAGATLVDAPVSGSTAAAESATLTVMAGGPAEAVDRVRPVLAAMSRAVHHVGGSGTGAVLKLAVNSVLFALTQAVAEALVLAERSGIDAAPAYDVFVDSAIAAPAVLYRREAFLAPESTPRSFRLALAAKDLGLVRGAADRAGAPIPQGRALAAIVGDAVAAGFGDHDLAALATWLRARPADLDTPGRS